MSVVTNTPSTASSAVSFKGQVLPANLSKETQSLVQMSNMPADLKRSLDLMIKLVGPGDLGLGDMDRLLGELDSLLSGLNMAVGKEGVRLNTAQQKESQKQAKEAAEAAAAAAAAAKEKAGESKVMGWLAAVASVIGAVAAVVSAVGSGGLLTAVAVVAVGLAVQQVTDMALQEADVKKADGSQMSVSFNAMIDAIVEQQIADGTLVVIRKNAQGEFVDENGKKLKENPYETAAWGAVFVEGDEGLAKWKSDWGIATMAIIMGAMIIAGGIGAMNSAGGSAGAGAGSGSAAGNAAAKGGEAVGKAAKLAKFAKVERIALATEVGMAAVEAGSVVAKGAIDLAIAELNRSSSNSEADARFYTAQTQDSVTARQLILEWLRQLSERYNANSELRSDNIDMHFNLARKFIA